MNTTQKASMGLTEWLMLLVLSVLWGGSFFFARIAVAEMSPFTLVFYRVSIAALVLFSYLKLTGRHLPTGRTTWLAFFGMGLINNVIPFSLLFWGQVHIASGLASILNAATPIFTVVVANRLLDDEKITRRKLTGVMLGLAGVGVMLGFGNFDASSGLGSIRALAMLACLGAALSYAFASVFGRRFARLGIGPVRVAFGQLGAASVIMIPVVLVSGGGFSLSGLATSTIAAVILLALFSTALAYILFFRILAAGGATNISLVTLLVPVSAILLGTVFLSESLSWNAYAGMALIAAGLIAIDGRLFSTRKVL